VWGNESSHSQVSSHFGSWNPDGLSNFQKAIARIKIHWIETLLISLKKFWNIDLRNWLTWPIWTLNTQVMAKRRVGSQISNLIPAHWELGIAPISLRVGGMRHIVEKISTRATTLLQTSSQSEVYRQNYGPLKL
jgi:hypothetical protein